MGRRKKNNLSDENERGRSTTNAALRETRRRRSTSSSQPAKFSNYIFKVLKQIHPQLSMTNKAMKVMDDFMHDIYTRLVAEAAGLVKFTRKSTLSAAEFQTASRLILPGELAKHAISDGTKAVHNFLQSRKEDAKRSSVRREVTDAGTSLNPTNIQGPVEIEIFGTVPKPLLNGSREIPLSNSDIEEYMEEDIEEDIEEESELEKDSDSIPRQELFPSKNTTTYVNSKGTVKQPAKQKSNGNNIKSSTNLAMTPINSSVDDSLIEASNTPVRNNVPGQSEESITVCEDDARSLKVPRVPPTPPTEAESDTSVSSSGSLNKPLLDDSSNHASLDNSNPRDVSMEPEAETMSTKSLQSSNGEDNETSNPVITVHVEVARAGNPTVVSDVTVLGDCDKAVSPDSSDSQSNSSKHLSSCSTSSPIDGQNNSVPKPMDSQVKDIELNPVPPSADSSTDTETSEACQTTVTVRCSKVLTTKSRYIH